MPSKTQFGQPANYNSSPATRSDGAASALEVDATGNLKTTINTITPGTDATSLGKAVDSVAGATDTGVAALVVRDDALSTLTPADGDYTRMRTDSEGALWVREKLAPAYEDNTAQVAKVEQRYTNFNISTATTTTVKSGAGYIDEIIVVGGTLGNVTIYDNTAGSGTVLCPTVTPVQNGVLLKHVTFSTGLTIVTASATVITGGIR